MVSCRQIPLLLLVFFFSIFAAQLSASALISVGHQVVSERRLLQMKKPCSVNFENQNYTIITSQCKGPDYPPEPCCSAFKEFACPFADQINDLTTDCSETMFSYITRVGPYPSGLFSSICRGDKEGLPCPAQPSSPTPNSATRLFIPLLFLFPIHFVFWYEMKVPFA